MQSKKLVLPITIILTLLMALNPLSLVLAESSVYRVPQASNLLSSVQQNVLLDNWISINDHDFVIYQLSRLYFGDNLSCDTSGNCTFSNGSYIDINGDIKSINEFNFTDSIAYKSNLGNFMSYLVTYLPNDLGIYNLFSEQVDIVPIGIDNRAFEGSLTNGTFKGLYDLSYLDTVENHTIFVSSDYSILANVNFKSKVFSKILFDESTNFKFDFVGDYVPYKNDSNNWVRVGSSVINHASVDILSARYSDTFRSRYMELLNPSFFNKIVNSLRSLVIGDSSSNKTSNDLSNKNTELNQSIGEFDTIEQDLSNDFKNNLDNIKVNEFDFSGNTSFTKSVSFVSNLYTRVVSDNPIGQYLGFSLVLGLAMLLIGRRLGG